MAAGSISRRSCPKRTIYARMIAAVLLGLWISPCRAFLVSPPRLETRTFRQPSETRTALWRRGPTEAKAMTEREKQTVNSTSFAVETSTPYRLGVVAYRKTNQSTPETDSAAALEIPTISKVPAKNQTKLMKAPENRTIYEGRIKDTNTTTDQASNRTVPLRPSPVLASLAAAVVDNRTLNAPWPMQTPQYSLQALAKAPLFVGRRPRNATTEVRTPLLVKAPSSSSRKVLQDKSPTDVLTVADLQAALLEWEREQQNIRIDSGPPRVLESTTLSEGKTVAFPQPTPIRRELLVRGYAVAGAFWSMLLAVSLAPDLWLVGACLGAVYGHSLGTQQQQQHAAALLVRGTGRRLTKATLQAYDAIQTMWFLYKTGQLSYQYYKTYAVLDNKFQIQQRMDAWNAKFQQGKLAFDRWEQKNEMGRKLLATARTLWLVEERRTRKSKIRVVQWLQRAVRASRQCIASFGQALVGRNPALKEFFQGVWTQYMETPDMWNQRVQSSLAAAATVLLVSSLVTVVSPVIWLAGACLVGAVAPEWPEAAQEGLADFITTTRRKATRTQPSKQPTQEEGPPPFWNTLLAPTPKRPTSRRRRPQKYHYFTTASGKKRYYRTGTSPWWTKRATSVK